MTSSLSGQFASQSTKSVACLVLCGLGVCGMTGRAGGWGQVKGSYLWSESPVTFPRIIWESMKERSLSSSKCLIQSEEKNHVMSGERHAPLFRPLAFSPAPAPCPPSRNSASSVTAETAAPQTGSSAISPSSSFCKSPKWVHFLMC